ncbi:MAG TPA: P-loop NTPase fold protein [Ktedonobacteraceae bacterium]|nr:P-loop NTPase fold protein [Ktedonobacteraceae bacterium]
MIPDNPILTKENDLLHRQPLASRIAGVINRFEGDESLVIGIEGEWGSGKTSFINMILEDLGKTNALLIKFNPWNFSDQNELIKDFFDSIIDALKEADGKEGKKKAKKIKEYASKLLKRSEITISPEFSAFGLFNFKVGDLNKFGGEKPLEKQKEAINKLFKEFGKRIVIVIDDIDRLDSHETKLIFKLVKITANFANTIFLLAYDRGKVSERIDEKGIKGDEYLKKIIQVSFTLPKPDPQDLYNILLFDLDTTIKGFDQKYWDDERWGNLFYSGFKRFFPTIRDIKRYISSLQLDLEIIGSEEVNPIDFLGIETIRVFAPEVYLTMADQKRVFTAINSLYVGSGTSTDRDNRKNICEGIIREKSPEGLAEAVKEIVLQLFPQMKGFYTNTYYGYEWQLNWRKQLRICAEDIFDKYFSLSVPSSTLSEKSLKDFLSNINDISVFTKSLKEFQEEDKLRLVLERLLDHLDEMSDQQKENLLISVFDFSEGVKDKKRGLLDLQDIDTQTGRLGYQALKRITPEKRVVFLTKILESTKSVFAPIQLINLLNHEIEERDKKESPEEPLLSKEDMSKLNKICVDKIKVAAVAGTLVTNKNLVYLLYAWKQWESEKAVKEYISELIKTTEGLLILLRGFEWEAMSQSVDSLVAKRTKKINKQALADFTNIDELDKRILELAKGELSQEDIELIKIYGNSSKDPFD